MGKHTLKRHPTTDLSIAHHEAGHAVVAWSQGITIHHVTIEPEGDTGGHLHRGKIFKRGLRPDIHTGYKVRDRGERLIRICLAGLIAERRFRPRAHSGHAESDHVQAADMILYLAEPGRHADTYMKLLHIETEQILDLYWGQTQALAHQLVHDRTMSGREIRKFIENHP
jgi:hypothetical protein